MKLFKVKFIVLSLSILILAGCSSLNKTQKGVIYGTAAGSVAGAVVGKVSGNTALGAIIGAAVGGTTGAIIGHKMDKQADDLKNDIPDAKVLRVGEGIVVEFSSNVLFGFDKSNLSSESKASLNKLVKVLQDYPDTNIELQGHTDSNGRESYNMNLSKERAAAAAGYLADHDIKRDRLTSIGYGESLPKYQNDTEVGRTQNRRVEFLITANEKMKADSQKEAVQ